MSYNHQQPTVAHPAQTGGVVTEATYELPPFADVFTMIAKFQKKQSIQDMLEALAGEGYYVVRRKQQK